MCDSSYTQTVDPKFEELEQKLTSLEMFLRQLIRNIVAWQDDLQVTMTTQHNATPSPSHPSLQKSADSRQLLSEGMSLYVTSDMRTLTSYQRGVTELQRAVKSHVSHHIPRLLTAHHPLLRQRQSVHMS